MILYYPNILSMLYAALAASCTPFPPHECMGIIFSLQADYWWFQVWLGGVFLLMICKILAASQNLFILLLHVQCRYFEA
ncbi:hypothetical protein V8C42DRAFT_313407 [Trichoderma barbatum]